MQLFKTLFAGVFISGLVLASSQIYAQPLTIVNNTNQDSTSIINGGLCSTVFGSDGVTKAHTTHVISEKLVGLACITNRTNCKADIYMTNNCTGPVIGSAVFDTTTGIKNINVSDARYQFVGTGFNITMNGGV